MTTAANRLLDDVYQSAHSRLVQPSKPQPKVIPVTEWPQYYNWPPVGGLRHLIFTNKDNFRDKVVVRCGRRVLIDVDRFHEWLDETNGRLADGEGRAA